MEKEIDDLKRSAIKLSFYTRGGATYEDVLNMSASEREMIADMASEHMETTKKSGLPFF